MQKKVSVAEGTHIYKLGRLNLLSGPLSRLSVPLEITGFEDVSFAQ